MFELIQVSDTRRDETATYKVILDKSHTVRSLLEEIISNLKDWGKVSVRGGGNCEYKQGKLLSNLSESDLDKKVIRVDAIGGWSLMNYWLEVEK